ncbi:MAG: SprT family zinc-dependent metalloprotease [Colwellia sp.]
MQLNTMALKPEYIEANGFIAEVIRTKRIKSVDIRVEEGAVSIMVPTSLEKQRISQLLTDKKKWVKDKINLHREAQPASLKKFVSGEAFSYLGRNYRLKIYTGSFKPIKLMLGYLTVTVPGGKQNTDAIRNALIHWYKEKAEAKLKEKVERYTDTVGVSPKSVGIKSYKSRWGSCSASGKIDFNWKIIMAPNRIVDYVVIHELCHLKHHDHSPKFWKEVERVIPDYLACKEWLKENAGAIEI